MRIENREESLFKNKQLMVGIDKMFWVENQLLLLVNLPFKKSKAYNFSSSD